MIVENKKLLEYLKYAKENKCVLKIMGISGKNSNVYKKVQKNQKNIWKMSVILLQELTSENTMRTKEFYG